MPSGAASRKTRPEARSFLFRKMAAVDEQLHVGVVSCQAKEAGVAKQVRARIAHVDDLKLAAHAAGRRQRGAHATDSRILASMLDEQRVEVSKPLLGALFRLA